VNLTKVYGRLVAVDRISFAVQRGEAFGFLGPNGAGNYGLRGSQLRKRCAEVLALVGLNGREHQK
jgi:ABC-type branched-subunit amino acid transport system ATPase component